MDHAVKLRVRLGRIGGRFSFLGDIFRRAPNQSGHFGDRCGQAVFETEDLRRAGQEFGLRPDVIVIELRVLAISLEGSFDPFIEGQPRLFLAHLVFAQKALLRIPDHREGEFAEILWNERVEKFPMHMLRGAFRIAKRRAIQKRIAAAHGPQRVFDAAAPGFRDMDEQHKLRGEAEDGHSGDPPRAVSRRALPIHRPRSTL